MEVWAGVATEIRKRVSKKAALYETYSNNTKKIVPTKLSRRMIPHSTSKDNVEGLQET